LALAFFFETIPWATSGPLLARRLSRYSRRQTLITLDLARSALVFAVCLVPYDTNLVLFIMFLLGNGNAAYAALRASGFKGIFATSEIDRAISWSSMGGEVASFAGPLIGAMLLSAGIAAKSNSPGSCKRTHLWLSRVIKRALD
jgi:predicted MFS family arabinose efflux permease